VFVRRFYNRQVKMSVRVVARIRPLLSSERDVDRILSKHAGADDSSSIVKIPNPKNLSEEYSFQFNSIYDQDCTQQQIFETEVSPTIKQLFTGHDVTIFAYGSTGTGKTHTMRGGKALADRGMIPRLLSNIYRKSRALEKSSAGQTTVEVSMSYYEIYNDRVFDLFEPPEKRNATGLPIREAEGGKTVVVGLTEEPCSTLKDFEVLYDKANANRSTGATKLNAHSSRSHAILCVKVTISSPTEVRTSTASAIDLAGSEDNRRTGNGKDRMVESASINKSLFVLAQCVEAIAKKHSRIPYRESKMTRILSLGQNNGITVMILNLAPTKAFHLDTLSSLNFANRTKKIEVREVENEPIYRGPPRQMSASSSNAWGMQRQPLRPLSNIVNVNLAAQRETVKDKPTKLFSVYSDRSKPAHRPSPHKRPADASLPSSRPLKVTRTIQPLSTRPAQPSNATKASIESIVEAKVSEILASRTLSQPIPQPAAISSEVQARLDSIEKRLQRQVEDEADPERAEGLSYLFMAKQHQARGEDGSALKMYEIAMPYFPGNEKLEAKIERLRERIARKNEKKRLAEEEVEDVSRRAKKQARNEDESYIDDNNPVDANEDYDTMRASPRPTKKPRRQRSESTQDRELNHGQLQLTPRTRHILDIINSRDAAQIRGLAGVGPKKAEAIVASLADREHDEEVRGWHDLGALKGVGTRGLEVMRAGVVL
jgi:DNA uptake protein ComE-like DNA-binding protein